MTVLRMDDWIRGVAREGGSDLHITAGEPPTIRVGDRLVPLESSVITNDETLSLMQSITPERNQRELQSSGETGFHFAFSETSRFHVVMSNRHSHVDMTLRQIPSGGEAGSERGE